MTYINQTGKNIGECMTGFGIHYPVYVFNSGNSDVEYTVTTSNSDRFPLSDSKFIINNGYSGSFDIYYLPEILASTASDITDITIFGQSVEDGSIDPSGLITLNITGSRIISTTPGHVTKFIALRNYDKINGLNYDFYWNAPTGTGSLKNYFLTGYTLDISTDVSFGVGSIVYSTNFNLATNTNDSPRFGDFYGIKKQEVKKISQTDYPFEIDQDYYARIYAYMNGVSGINIYATGVDSLSDELSTEVINGNSGTKVNIEFVKRPLDVYITNGDYKDYKLFDKIIEANGTSKNFGFVSGINIYLPNNSSFTSSDENNYAIDLQNGIFENFSGTSNTNINIFITNSTKLFGSFGKGGDISLNPITLNNNRVYDFQTTFNLTDYSKSNAVFSDAKNGGNVFNFNCKSQKDTESFVRTDLKYNLYIQKNSFIASGGGGNKAGIGIFAGKNNTQGYIASSFDNIQRQCVFPINGSYNKYGLNYKYNIYSPPQQAEKDNAWKVQPSAIVANVFSPQSGYGEQGVDKIVMNQIAAVNNIPIGTFRESKSFESSSIADTSLNSFDFLFKKINNSAVPSCGYLLKKYSNSTVTCFINDTDISTDYVFRFNNADLSSGTSWVGKDSAGSTIINLNTVVGSPSYSANYQSSGYKAITFSNSSLSGSFASSINCEDFDLYMVGVFDGTIPSANTSFKFLNWFSTSMADKISSKHVNIRNFPEASYKTYSKESKVFNIFSSILYNFTIDNSQDFFSFKHAPNTSFYQLSKDLTTESRYPFILNIRRSGTFYSIFINGELHALYDLNFLTTSNFRNSSNFIKDLNVTTFQLINDLTGSMSSSFFDIIFYNRVLFNNENQKLLNSLLNSYINLFTGTSTNSLVLSNDIRMPNIFNIAGKVSTI